MQLIDSKTTPDSKIEPLCQFFEARVDGYLLSLGYTLARLTDFDLDDPESSRQFHAYMEKADWNEYARQLEGIVATYQSLQRGVRDKVDMPSSEIEQMGSLCSFLSNCTTSLKRSASLENIANSLKERASGALPQGA